MFCMLLILLNAKKDAHTAGEIFPQCRLDQAARPVLGKWGKSGTSPI